MLCLDSVLDLTMLLSAFLVSLGYLHFVQVELYIGKVRSHHFLDDVTLRSFESRLQFSNPNMLFLSTYYFLWI